MSIWDRVLIACFMLLVMLPGGGLLLGIGSNDPTDENRTLAAAPGLEPTWPSLRAFPDAFARYFEDAFAFRSSLVRWQATLRLRALGVSPESDVILGREGWYFYGADGGVEDYAVPSLMSPEDLDVWRDSLQATQDWLTSQGIRYLFVVAPGKPSIYPEYMPSAIHRLHQASRTDQLLAHLRAHSTVRILDLRPTLLAAKAVERVYHRTDTHWNDRGAWAAYQEIATQVGLRGLPRTAFIDRVALVPGKDLARTLGLSDRLLEEDLQLVPVSPRAAHLVEPPNPDPGRDEPRLVTMVDNQSLPRAVILRDSFGSALVPFLSEHFSRAVYLWEYDVDPEVIERERPAIVIQQWAGRRLSTRLPYNAIAAFRGSGQATGDAGPSPGVASESR